MDSQVRERSGGKPWLIGGVIGCLAAVLVGAALAAGAYFWRAKQKATPVATAAAPATETTATAPPPETTTPPIAMPAEVPAATETAGATVTIDTAASAVAPIAPVQAQAAPEARTTPPPPKPLTPPPAKKKTTSTKTAVVAAADETQPVKPSKSSSKSVILSVSSTVEDSSEITAALRREIRSRLESRGIDVGEGGYKASIVITRVREVSRKKRVLLGAFAGKAGIDVDIALRDPDGSKVGSTKVEGRSSGKTIFSGTSSQAIDEAAEKIASFIAGKL